MHHGAIHGKSSQFCCHILSVIYKVIYVFTRSCSLAVAESWVPVRKSSHGRELLLTRGCISSDFDAASCIMKLCAICFARLVIEDFVKPIEYALFYSVSVTYYQA
jgi:hypothetical protein